MLLCEELIRGAESPKTTKEVGTISEVRANGDLVRLLAEEMLRNGLQRNGQTGVTGLDALRCVIVWKS
jgi:hypothetical protein